jgi:hypothetical protein
MTHARVRSLGRLVLPLAAGLVAASAAAKVATRSLDEVAHAATVIAVVRVDRVVAVGDRTVARATVLRPLKGTFAGESLAFVARPTWVCDVSGAVRGETAVVLLEEPTGRALGKLKDQAAARAALRRALGEPLPLRVIAHAGRGRFAVVEPELVAHPGALAGGLTLPAALEPVAPPRARPGRRPLLRLVDLEAHLAALVSASLPVTVSLDAASATRSGDQLLVRCTATLRNRSGGPITVRSNFGGVFDGLTLVVRRRDGLEAARQAYVHHQSPYAEANAYVLADGATTRPLVFPLAGLARAPRDLTLQLVGGLPGHALAWGLQSQVVRVTVAAEK